MSTKDQSKRYHVTFDKEAHANLINKLRLYRREHPEATTQDWLRAAGIGILPAAKHPSTKRRATR